MTVTTFERGPVGDEPGRPKGHSLDVGRAVGGAALILTLGNLSGSVLGFIRQAVIGAAFGANHRTDAFYAASIVPQMFYDLTIGAAISAALIPTFTEIVERDGRDALWRLLGNVLAIAWLVLLAVVVALLLVARPFVSLLVIGVQPSARGVELVRLLVPTLFFLGTSAIFLSTLYSLRRFAVPAFAPGLYHLGIIAGALGLARSFGIVALPIGALAGSAAQAVVQAGAVLRLRPTMRIRPTLTPEVRRILRLYLPVAAGLIVSIVGQIIDVQFKLHLRAGGLVAMQFATTYTQFPIGIAVAALSFAVLPTLSSHAAFHRPQEFKKTLALGIRFVLFLTLPAAAGYIALGSPIIALLNQHGQFHASDTQHAATALAGYAIQIPFVGVDQLLIFAFYARRNTVTPMLVGVLGVCVYVVSAFILLPRLQILGLALANTLQNSLHALILLVILVGAIGGLGARDILPSVGRSLAATAVMWIAAWGALSGVGGVLTTHNGPAFRLVDVALPMCAAVIAYLGSHAVLRSQELNLLVSLLRERGPALRKR